ncbi:MAG TPA: FHA domain-containing protein [Gemmatimonadaceae bacterium]|nr:FHA domain-containing protein [Gemmatimonadaceae bacterium]
MTAAELAAATAAIRGSGRIQNPPRISLLGEAAEATKSYLLDRGEAVIGRDEADIRFGDDHFLSPVHARLELRGGQLTVRDLGSRNGTWMFIDQPTRLSDCDLLLIGSQLIRFRRLGYPGPHPPEADATRRMGSAVPTVDIAVLEQLRADGSVRDVLHLSPGRSIAIGRELGDWLFPYDATMSARHAEVRSEDSEFYVHDVNSRNGVAMTVRGERVLRQGQRLLVGDQILRVESA